MGQYTNIAFSCLVFLFALFLSKAIFTALGATLVFLLLTALLEAAWRFRESKWFPLLIRPAVNLLITAISALSFYVLLYLPLEFQITENWKLTPKISPLYSFSFLLFLVVVLNPINWHQLVKEKAFRFSLLILIIFCGLIYREYRQEKLAREYLPKIYKVNPDWGIQSSLINIEGVNFFPVWKKGSVMLDTQESVIKAWDEKLIVVGLPVPIKFGQVKLYVKRSDGIISNIVPLEIRDPDSLGIQD